MKITLPAKPLTAPPVTRAQAHPGLAEPEYRPALQRGMRVRSLNNQHMIYRISKLGPKRAVIVAEGSGGFFRCYCTPELLRAI